MSENETSIKITMEFPRWAKQSPCCSYKMCVFVQWIRSFHLAFRHIYSTKSRMRNITGFVELSKNEVRNHLNFYGVQIFYSTNFESSKRAARVKSASASHPWHSVKWCHTLVRMRLVGVMLPTRNRCQPVRVECLLFQYGLVCVYTKWALWMVEIYNTFRYSR